MIKPDFEIRRRAFALLALVLLILLVSTSIVAAADQVILDWELDAQGNPIAIGQVIDDEYFSTTGISVTVRAVSARGVAAIFPSHAPSPADLDLGSPNETCPGGGPGVGAGGEVGQPGENCLSHGNVLIMPTIGDADGDGFIDGVPDDDHRGGTIIFLFSEPVQIDYIEILDQESSENLVIESYSDVAGADLLDMQSPTGFGDNSYEFLPIVVSGVRRLDFDFRGSGAIASLAYRPPDPTAVSLAAVNASARLTPAHPLIVVSLLGLATAASLWFMRSQASMSQRVPVRLTRSDSE